MSATEITMQPTQQQQQQNTIDKSTLPDVVKGSKHDLSTYWGRVRHFAEVTDMRTLLTTDAALRDAKEKLESYEKFRTNKMSPEEEASYVLPPTERLWDAKKIKDAVLHPDLGDKIPVPFRMSAFVPMNIAIVSGMLQARSIPATIFWQTVNQTYNVCVNHSNRNASNTMSNEQLAINYLAAVSSSVGTALGLNQFVQRTTLIKTEAMKQNMLKVVPFIAVSVANILNIGLMRRNEMTDGITVKDHEGNERGKSAVAGRTAVTNTIISRLVLITPSMIVQPYMMTMMEGNLFKKFPVARQPMNLFTIGLSIAIGLPLCIGLFPQFDSLNVEDMEPKFHNIVDSKGNKVHKLFYNKGL